MAFGLTAQGFNAATFEDVLDAVDGALRDALGANIDLGAESVLGQIRAIFAEQASDLWALAEVVYASTSLGGATGQALDDFVALSGISRRAATYSTVTLTLSGTSGTVIPAGSQVRDASTGTVWETDAEATLVAGTATVGATPSTTGPVLALAGTLTEIVTPVTGWASATNGLDAVPGTAGETDAALRARFVQSFRLGGGSSDEAIRATLLQITGVSEVTVTSNRSTTTDAAGRPPHSVEAVVRGGDDQAVADALWTSIPAGIEPYGLISIAVTDGAGGPQTVGLTRPVDVPIWLVVVYSPDVGLQDAAFDVVPPPDPAAEHAASSPLERAIQAEILDYGTTLLVGQDLVTWKILRGVETSGLDSIEIRSGTAPSPSLSQTIAISGRELARLDSSRLTFIQV